MLQPEARKHRRFQEEVLDSLRVRESGAPIDLLERAVFEAGEAGITMAALAQAPQRPVAEVRADAEVLLEGEELLALGPGGDPPPALETLRERLQQTLEAFHQANRLREWMPRESCARARPAVSPEAPSTDPAAPGCRGCHRDAGRGCAGPDTG